MMLPVILTQDRKEAPMSRKFIKIEIPNSIDKLIDLPPMHKSALENDTETIDQLRMDGIDVDIRDAGGRTPMCFAVLGNSVEALAYLEMYDADPESQDLHGITPVMFAAFGNSVSALKWLGTIYDDQCNGCFRGNADGYRCEGKV